MKGKGIFHCILLLQKLKRREGMNEEKGKVTDKALAGFLWFTEYFYNNPCLARVWLGHGSICAEICGCSELPRYHWSASAPLLVSCDLNDTCVCGYLLSFIPFFSLLLVVTFFEPGRAVHQTSMDANTGNGYVSNCVDFAYNIAGHSQRKTWLRLVIQAAGCGIEEFSRSSCCPLPCSLVGVACMLTTWLDSFAGHVAYIYTQMMAKTTSWKECHHPKCLSLPFLWMEITMSTLVTFCILKWLCSKVIWVRWMGRLLMAAKYVP